ncbi:hypothetical protein AAG570_005611 [Ranatra chinensis]|uniref:Helicase ATP-binding domain-containing protein n=1 Tax=Ranatra chinensis TaxID=642074 RepID=A0ABD0XY11_9HEMI
MNGILADDMGLGKTVQAIALICHLYEQDVGGPFLIVVPLSTLPNWLIEFERFAPQIPVLMFYGSVNEKKKKKPMLAARQMTSWGRKVCPVVITNYHTSISECKALASIHWKYMIVDEGHVIKNYKTILFRTLSSFPSMNRLLLTGTPLQNNLSELWSLLNFLLPEIFNNLNAFETWFQIEEMDKEGSAELLIKQEKENHILFLLQEVC